MDKLIESLGSLVSGGLVALMTWWLTTRARNRQDQDREREVLRGHADALIVTVADLLAAGAANRMLWEMLLERGRTVLLAGLACVGGAARARIAGGTDVQSGLVGMGCGAELLAQERIVSKQAAAALREPFTRIAAAAAPLLCCPDPALVTATEELVNAAGNLKDTARLEEKLAAFGRAARVATTPPSTRRERHRARRAD
ncbi:hypothetical protein ACFUJU_19835 [Streptomyces sp. NPDC057235]|uniref:hypothetical protein n=1 Tax=Streptomyces sp. NPDC057235 TaxID=3346058 RepID=UPI003643500F